MKAIRLHQRGGPDELIYEDAPRPIPAPGDALVQVYATAITPTELTWDQTYQNPDGSPRLPTIPGHEVSGVIEAVAPGIKDLGPGDAVYGLADFTRDGAAAEYLAIRAGNLALKPRTLDHVHSAAVTLSGLTAWQALFTHGALQRGQKVLIHAGAGGVGTFAVQLAHLKGAHVITTSSGANLDFVRSLGADETIDYTSTRFEDVLRDVDIVLDAVGGDTVQRSWRVLRGGGAMISVTTLIPEDEAREHGARGLFFIVEPNREQLEELAKLIDAGSLKVIVASVQPLARARDAFELALKGHTRGKIVLQVRDSTRQQ
ncbi:MAG TPA: NADP-dependent oxidoreductase [Bryobacteraceae bacterium]|nr:NADP-dependent oxidoreductase [Bryobacteraceae bacterium]